MYKLINFLVPINYLIFSVKTTYRLFCLYTFWNFNGNPLMVWWLPPSGKYTRIASLCQTWTFVLDLSSGSRRLRCPWYCGLQYYFTYSSSEERERKSPSTPSFHRPGHHIPTYFSAPSHTFLCPVVLVYIYTYSGRNQKFITGGTISTWW